MHNKKQRFMSTLFTLTLTLVLAGVFALPGTSQENQNSAYLQYPVEEEAQGAGAEEGIQPLTDLDEVVTKIEE